MGWFDWFHPFLKISKPDISKKMKFFHFGAKPAACGHAKPDFLGHSVGEVL
jgi:hypothetical protein